MSKYNEIMNKVTLSEESRQRIMQNIRKADKKRIRFDIRVFAAAAACFCAAVFGVIAVRNSLNRTGVSIGNSSQTEDSGENSAASEPINKTESDIAELVTEHKYDYPKIYTADENTDTSTGIWRTENAEQLSEIVGFYAEVPESVRSQMAAAVYYVYFGSLAEVRIDLPNQRFIYNKFRGSCYPYEAQADVINTDDNMNYMLLGREKDVVNIGGGEIQTYYEAMWCDNEFTYVWTAAVPMMEEQWVKHYKEIIEASADYNVDSKREINEKYDVKNSTDCEQ